MDITNIGKALFGYWPKEYATEDQKIQVDGCTTNAKVFAASALLFSGLSYFNGVFSYPALFFLSVNGSPISELDAILQDVYEQQSEAIKKAEREKSKQNVQVVRSRKMKRQVKNTQVTPLTTATRRTSSCLQAKID